MLGYDNYSRGGKKQTRLILVGVDQPKRSPIIHICRQQSNCLAHYEWVVMENIFGRGSGAWMTELGDAIEWDIKHLKRDGMHKLWLDATFLVPQWMVFLLIGLGYCIKKTWPDCCDTYHMNFEDALCWLQLQAFESNLPEKNSSWYM